ncbi:hypothetical protein SDC9_159055 [bioreactor metagenome]|uniref:Uncharacterized protein n=1 Tax=bioreactor metagenome TaxID=1076179 RepID=A0A645FBU7_9ZZZZ
MITEKHKTPDKSLFCRASAQDGDLDTRDFACLSTESLPEIKKHQTNRSSVGRQPRKVSTTPESPPVYLLNRHPTTKKYDYPFDLDSRILCALLTKAAAYI